MKIEDAKVRVSGNFNKQISKNRPRASIYTEDYRGEHYNVAIEKLKPFKKQARKIFDPKNLQSLADTIKEHGIRQPLTVIASENEEGFYEIISGERRYRAAVMIGLKTVPCIVYHDQKTAEEVAIIENIQREDLHPIELMKAYNSLLENKICSSMQAVADKIGVAKSTVVETIGLKNISEEIQKILLENRIVSRKLLRTLCKVSSEEQEKILEDYRKKLVKSSNKKLLSFNINIDSDIITVDFNKLSILTNSQKSDMKKILKDIIEQIN